VSDAVKGRSVRAQATDVPRIGFGTWQIMGSACREAVRDALEIGYRHIDTARVYENERQVARGIVDSRVAREDVFLTTKVWMDDLEPRRLRLSLERSLRELDTAYVDLLLIHWPNPEVPLADSLGEMQRLVEEGKARHLGVSNFPDRMVAEAVEIAPIFCNQVEYHVGLGQERLLELAREHDFVVGAYAPFGHGEILDEPVLVEIGEELGRSPAQVALRWLIEQDRVCALPKAASHENRVANFEAYDFELSAEDRERIDALPKDRRRFDPGWAPAWD
jgi:2,5-diketo-D-gluconate reductase B